MQRKDRLDAFGGSILLGVTTLLAFNQILVKLVNQGLQPVFFAGLRSALAVFFVLAWLVYKRRPPRLRRATFGPGVLMGAVFAAEFLCLFIALDLTTVGRAAVIFYSMPVWFAIMAHFGLGERITPLKALGLCLAFTGAAWAIVVGSASGEGSLIGDLFALGAPGAGPAPPISRGGRSCAPKAPRCSFSGWSWSRARCCCWRHRSLVR